MSTGDQWVPAPGANSIPQWVARSKTYGDDHDELAAYIQSIDGKDISVEVIEVDSAGKLRDVSNSRACC